MPTETFAQLVERGFAHEVGFGTNPALLVIDYIAGFTNPEQALGADVGEEIRHTNRLIDAAHIAGVPVFFSTIRYDEHNLIDAGMWIRKINGLRTLSLENGGAEIDPRLHRQEIDQTIVKKFASCFFGTDLLSRLVYGKVDTLILAGCTTSGCVRATAVDSCQYGFHTIVAREAVTDRMPAAHEQSLIDIQLKYGDVLPVDMIVAKLVGTDSLDNAIGA